MTAAPVDPIAVALTVAGTLETLGIAHTIGGSIASSIAGEPRATIDIDFVAALSEADVPRLVSALSADFYVDERALRRAVRDRGVANLIHQPSQLKVDIHVCGGTPLDEQQIARRQAVRVIGDRVLHVHPPEDILLQKLRWYDMSGGVSDRQWRDILGIIRVQGPRLDHDYLLRNAPVLGVSASLRRALRQGEGR